MFDFFAEHALTPEFLRQVSLRQRALLTGHFDALDLPESVIARDRDAPPSAFGGFLALRSPHASHLRAALAERGVLTDSRGDHLHRPRPLPVRRPARVRRGRPRHRAHHAHRRERPGPAVNRTANRSTGANAPTLR